jgi:hypothetical protein
MKKAVLFILFSGIASVFFFSCSSDDGGGDNPPIYIFPTDAAAKYVAVAFCINSGGINLHMENAAQIASLLKSGSFDSSFNLKKTDTNLTIRYAYDVTYGASYVAAATPKVIFSYTATGAFNSSAMSSTDQQNGEYDVTGLDTAAVRLAMTGTGGDGGFQQSGYYNVNFSSSFQYTLHNVEFDKQTFQITGGTATLHVDGIGPANIPFSYSGTITFTGNRNASMELGGENYTMSLLTGAMSVVKK